MAKKNGALEFLVGLIVLGGVVFSLGYVYTYHYHKQMKRLRLKAEFDHVGSLTIGSPVKINGARVGEVLSIVLNPKRHYTVVVTFQLNQAFSLSDDSEAIIENESLLGQQVLAINPGSSGTFLTADSTIFQTRSPSSFSQLLEKFMFSSKADDKISDVHDDDSAGDQKHEDNPDESSKDIPRDNKKSSLETNDTENKTIDSGLPSDIK